MRKSSVSTALFITPFSEDRLQPKLERLRDSMSNMLLFLFFFGLALGAVTPSDVPEVSSQRANCPPQWISLGGRCYKYVATRMTWSAARQHCRSQSSDLVSIHSLAEHIFVKLLVWRYDKRNGPTWMGLNDLQAEGRWVWSNGCPVRFTRWNSGEPNNLGNNEHCGQLNFGSQQNWKHEQCQRQFAFVCAIRTSCR